MNVRIYPISYTGKDINNLKQSFLKSLKILNNILNRFWKYFQEYSLLIDAFIFYGKHYQSIKSTDHLRI
jgi:hypothetical protein